MHSAARRRPYEGPASAPAPPDLNAEASAAERAMGWLLVGGLVILIVCYLLP